MKHPHKFFLTVFGSVNIKINKYVRTYFVVHRMVTNVRHLITGLNKLNQRIEKYEEILSNLERHISIRNDEIALYLKQIDQLNDRMNHYDQMIMKLR